LARGKKSASGKRSRRKSRSDAPKKAQAKSERPADRPVSAPEAEAATEPSRRATPPGARPGPGAPTPSGPVRSRRVLGLFRIGSIDFMGRRRLFALISAALILVSLLSLGLRGLNLGIDFTGGNSYRLEFARPVTDDEIRSALGDAGVAGAVVRVDRDEPSRAMLRTPYLDAEAEVAMKAALEEAIGEFTASAGDAVSPTIGGELLRDALVASLLAVAGILAYIAVRFEHRFAAAGVAALVHDALVTVGVFSLLGLEVNSAFVAAILTVIGYSINDTIVVFDRIRDNLKGRVKEDLALLANRSVNETFVRSVNTGLSTFLAVSAVYLFGGDTTRDFALALMVGTVVGTYSSICVATPVWLAWRGRDERQSRASLGKSLRSRRARA